MSNIILVTGASRGFGELITKTLSSAGNVVYAAMRDIHGKNKKQAEEMIKWAKENKAKVKTIELDVKNEDSIKEAISKIIQQENKLDVLINNAGIGNYGITESFTDDEIKELFDVNVFGSIKTIKESLPQMRKQKSGLIIQVSSQLGRTVIPLMGLYSGTKFAIEAICESISEEVGDLGIDVCIVQPGGYPTDFANNFFSDP